MNNTHTNKSFDKINLDWKLIQSELKLKLGIEVYESWIKKIDLLEEFNNINDEYEGLKVSYYLNGNLKERKEYSYGLLNGDFKIFYENGNLKEQSTYKSGVQVGPRTTYDENGKKIKTEKFFNDRVYEQQTF